MEQSVVLTTERLILREFELADSEALMQVLGDPVAMQYYPAPFPRREVDEWIWRNRARYRDSGFGIWAMALHGSGELIGDCGCFVRDLEGDYECEMGWHVRRDLWNRGYATEAARHCIEYAFWKLGMPRIIAMVRPENLSSCRVAEKNGMNCDRAIFWRGYDHCVYVKNRAEP
ncbi:MAG TPA: GNAT family N-acetyltransferase [Candidatus Limnocylindrales bacterium]|nr:GNAT family N-acetyltransferase [Candidatus Limnocylindrales bacterium]